MYNYGGIYNRIAPLTLNDTPNMNMQYWTRSLYQRLTALINIKNIPDGSDNKYAWDYDALIYALFWVGFMPVFESAKYGVVPSVGTLAGYGIQFQPTGVIINNPYFAFSRPLKIGEETELIKLTPDYSGVMDIVAKYAAELKEIDTSIRASAKNSRLAYALIANSDRTARTLKGIREKILNGDDVIIDEKLTRDKGADPEALPWYQFDRDLKNSFILNDLLEARRTTLVDFYREIGVRMIDDKKERMITSEVNAGNAETFIRSEVWAETLKRSVKKVNAMFGLNLEIEINRPDFKGGESYVSE